MCGHRPRNWNIAAALDETLALLMSMLQLKIQNIMEADLNHQQQSADGCMRCQIPESVVVSTKCAGAAQDASAILGFPCPKALTRQRQESLSC